MPAAMRAFFGPIGFRAGNARLGASVKWRLAFSKASASMGFRRADWLKRGAKRTLVRERCEHALMACSIPVFCAWVGVVSSAGRMLHKTQRLDARIGQTSACMKKPGLGLRRAGRRPLGRRSWGSKLPLAERPGLGLRRAGQRPLGRRSLGSKVPLALYLWKKRRFSYFGSQHTLMPSVR